MALGKIARIKPHRPLQVNMTSMVDIVFLLIIFFVLVSQFISAENVTVELPNPDNSLARKFELAERVVLNCRYGGAPAAGATYQLGPIVVRDAAELERRLLAVKADRPDVQDVLRADRRIEYHFIRDAMSAIARAGIENINIAAEVED